MVVTITQTNGRVYETIRLDEAIDEVRQDLKDELDLWTEDEILKLALQSMAAETTRAIKQCGGSL